MPTLIKITKCQGDEMHLDAMVSTWLSCMGARMNDGLCSSHIP
jgi:hypothetical protein